MPSTCYTTNKESVLVIKKRWDKKMEDRGGRNIIFGKYEMGRLLGQGTFAKVYYAKNLVTSESVAIKVINKDQVRKEGMCLFVHLNKML